MPEGTFAVVTEGTSPPEKEAEERERRRLQRLDEMNYGSLGIELVVATLVGLGVGYWLDWSLGTFPWITLVGLGVGAAAGFLKIYELLQKAERAEAEERQAGRKRWRRLDD